MSLKMFHIVFVTLSSLLAFVFAGWSLHFHAESDGATYLVLGVFSALVGVALIGYGFWFWRKITTREEERRRRRKLMRPIPALIILGLWMLSARTASACSVCYGEAEGPMIDAARLGVWLLFGLVGAIQLSFALFFVYLWRRARKYRQTTL
jgi:amino acid transporter